MKKTERKSLVLNDLNCIYSYLIDYSQSYDIIDNKNGFGLDCYRTVTINNKKVQFRMSYCPKKRYNLGYRNFKLYSLGVSFENDINVMTLLFDVMINNNTKQSVARSLAAVSDDSWKECYGDSSIMLVKDLMANITQENPFFAYFDTYADLDIEIFVKEKGL